MASSLERIVRAYSRQIDEIEKEIGPQMALLEELKELRAKTAALGEVDLDNEKGTKRPRTVRSPAHREDGDPEVFLAASNTSDLSAVLGFIQNYPDNTQQEIKKAVGLSGGQVSRAIRGLAASGQIEAHPDDYDRGKNVRLRAVRQPKRELVLSNGTARLGRIKDGPTTKAAKEAGLI